MRWLILGLICLTLLLSRFRFLRLVLCSVVFKVLKSQVLAQVVLRTVTWGKGKTLPFLQAKIEPLKQAFEAPEDDLSGAKYLPVCLKTGVYGAGPNVFQICF